MYPPAPFPVLHFMIQMPGVGRSASSADLCLSQGSIAVKKHHNQGSSYVGKCLVGGLLSFQGLACYHHVEEHGGRREEWQRALHPAHQAAGREFVGAGRQRHRQIETETETGPGNTLAPTRPCLRQQCHHTF